MRREVRLGSLLVGVRELHALEREISLRIMLEQLEGVGHVNPD